MITVKLSTSYPELPHIRQTPGGRGIWGDVQFFIDQDVPEADFWAVHDNLEVSQLTTRCRKDGTIYFGGEPPFVREYNHCFLRQFDTVVTAQSVRHPHHIQSQQCLPWNVGMIHNRKLYGSGNANQVRLGYDEFKLMDYFEKPRLISVISSNKTMTPGHVQRMEFIALLQAHFGDRLDVYGIGFNPIPDKWDALAPYQYHISLENCSYSHYWTEKLADAYLAWSYPIYYGCPNLAEYFPTLSFALIDINCPAEAIAIIESVIAKSLYDAQLVALAEARRRVLDEYNLFAVIARWCQEKARMPSRYVRKTLRYEVYFKRQKSLKDHFQRAVRYLHRRLATASLHNR